MLDESAIDPTLDVLRVDPSMADFADVGSRDEPVEAVLERLVMLASRVLPGRGQASVTLVRSEVATTAAASNDTALRLDATQYEQQRGPCFDAASAGTHVIINDVITDERWPEFAAAARDAGFVSSLAIALPVVREVTGALNIYLTDKDAICEESLEIAVTLASYVAVAVANIQRYESAMALARQMQDAMTTRAVIEQAKGIVMAEQRCTSDEAFNVLVKISQERHIKLRDVAERLVASTGSSPAS
jgi:GAF domain-containing protein